MLAEVDAATIWSAWCDLLRPELYELPGSAEMIAIGSS